MGRFIASALVVSMLSGCVIGSRRTRFTASGITIGVGGTAALVTYVVPERSTNDGGPTVGMALLVAAGIVVGLGFLGVFAAAADIPPAPTRWQEHEPELVRQADVAARAGHCEASNAIAREVYAEHEDYYRRDFLTNPVIVGCMQAGWTKARSTPASPASR